MWMLLVVLVLVIVTVVALVSHRARLTGDADPLVVAGIAIAGASVTLITTIGFVMLLVMAVGVACIVIGARRGRAQRS